VSDDEYRLSFEAVAEQYERARPSYAPDALAWLAGRIGIGPGRRVLDLAAGTGKLTRQLVALGASVVAVEPGDAMRAVLARVVPEAEALTGSAEAIPLADGAVDAVTVGQAFHWFRPGEALAEMHRVLRPGGGVALLWNQWDGDDPRQREIDELVDPLRSERTRRDADLARSALVESPLFGDIDEQVFRHVRVLDADRLVDWVSSTSAVVKAAPSDRARIEARVRELAGDGEVELTLVTSVLAFDRVS
jgi:SAM-dependent methyltransferase